MRTVAFYLPQFHTIPENDEWWGSGFTEWTNVARARPLFSGHDHPRRPAPPLGEYDLTDANVHSAQSSLARRYGVDGFCMYFYWFDGHRLLERPLDMWRSNPSLLPYCLSWANESWTRRWDGKEHDVLMPQTYADGFERAMFESLLPHFSAPHYMRQHDCPILIIHRADLIPDPLATTATLRRFARESGLRDLYLVAAETRPGIDPRRLGFDASAEFPPVGSNTAGAALLSPLRGLDPNFSGRLMSYERVAKSFATRRAPRYTRHRGVMPGWDNSARRGTSATIYVGGSPDRFAKWLLTSRAREQAERGEDGLLFINAWNEWAEGAYLEPDVSDGLGYLEALTRTDAQERDPRPRFPTTVVMSKPQFVSILRATAGTVLNGARRAKSFLRSLTSVLAKPRTDSGAR